MYEDVRDAGSSNFLGSSAAGNDIENLDSCFVVDWKQLFFSKTLRTEREYFVKYHTAKLINIFSGCYMPTIMEVIYTLKTTETFCWKVSQML